MDFLIPPWAKAAIAAGLLLLGVFIGYRLSGGKIQKLQGRVTVLETELGTAEEANKLLIANAVETAETIDAAREAQAAAELRYRAAVENPPEVVTRWRTRWREAPAAIVSNPCPDQLVEVNAFLLEALAEEVPP